MSCENLIPDGQRTRAPALPGALPSLMLAAVWTLAPGPPDTQQAGPGGAQGPCVFFLHGPDAGRGGAGTATPSFPSGPEDSTASSPRLRLGGPHVYSQARYSQLLLGLALGSVLPRCRPHRTSVCLFSTTPDAN